MSKVREEFILLIEESGLDQSDADFDHDTNEFKNKNVNALWLWHNKHIEAKDKEIEKFISFVDSIQGKDLGGADVLSWGDISCADDLRGFLESYRALNHE